MCLNEDMIKELIPKIGIRAKFMAKLNELKKNMGDLEMQVGLKYS
jgi:hypothetical protein